MNFEDEGEMTASLRLPTSSPAAGPLDVDDLLSEILLRLSPQPSSLPRASAVCKRWRTLVSDAGFIRRFRLHHRRNPPLLGFIDRYYGYFRPTLDFPNRVPPRRLSLQRQRDDAECPVTLGCHHGLVLLYLPKRLQVRVWDPVTGNQHCIALPPRFSAERTIINGAVLRSMEDVHFQVVLIMADGVENHRRAFACVYLSETGVWGNPISTPITCAAYICPKAAVLVGVSFYWLLLRYSSGIGILEFDLDKQSLAVIQVPVDNFDEDDLTITRAECGGLGFLSLSGFTVQLWNWRNDCNDAASWRLEKTIQLDKLLSLNLEEMRRIPSVIGFAEYNNVVFMETIRGIFMINFESLQFMKLSETDIRGCHPFERVYAAGT